MCGGPLHEGYTALNTRFRDTVLELAPLHTDLARVHDSYLVLLRSW